MNNYGIEEGEPPVYCPTENNYIDKKWYNDVLEKCRVMPDEFSRPNRGEKSHGKVADRIFG